MAANSSTSIQSRNSDGRGQRNGSGSAVQVQAGHRAQDGPGLELGVGLAGEHLDVVAERGQLTGQVAQVDALAAAVRLAAVGDQRDTERATCREHAASHLSWHPLSE